MNILLRNIILVWTNPFVMAREEYANTLAIEQRLHDESLGSVLVELLLEGLRLHRDLPRLREEIVLIR